MANKAISELPQALNVNNQDLFVLEQSGIAKKLTAETFITEQGIIDALAEALDGHGGIQSVTLSSVSGRVRTYLITFTDGSATTFQVYDGTSIDRIVKTSTAGLTDTYTVFMNDGTTTFFTVTNGADGTVSEAMLNDALKDKAPAVTETTESSAIANFPDGADDMVMHNIVAEIEPVQDLHGQSNPYPVGGGVNKLPPMVDGIYEGNGAKAVVENGVATLSGTTNASGNAFIIPLSETFTVPSTTAYIHMGNSAVNGSVSSSFELSTDAANTSAAFTFNPANRIAEIPSAKHGVTWDRVRFYLGSGVTLSGTFAPMVCMDNIARSFSPYSNICPISGWTGCNVTRTGTNLANLLEIGTFTESKAAGSTYKSMMQVNTKRLRSPALIPTYGKQITVSWSNYSNYGVCFTYFDSDGLYLGQSAGFQSWRWAVTTINNPAIYYMACAVRRADNATMTDSDISALHLQVEFGTTATAYEPYIAPATASLSWQDEVGTVYGGTIDVATGLLTVDRAMVDLGTKSWSKVANNNYANFSCLNYFPYAVYDAYAPTFICSIYKSGANNTVSPSEDNYVWLNPQKVLRIKDLSKDSLTAEEFATAMSGVQLCYELATPQTYQLTPQEVKTLLGTNNVWADTGNVSVTYTADTKMFIEKLTMPTEDDLIANQAITSGKYFMVGNSLYLALANIASGAQITIGTNAQRVSLADALNTINS